MHWMPVIMYTELDGESRIIPVLLLLLVVMVVVIAAEWLAL